MVLDRLQQLDRRVLGRAEQRFAGSGEPGSWYGGRKMRLVVGLLATVGGLYDVIVVAIGLAPVVTLAGAPLMLVVGIHLTWSAATDATGGAGQVR